jgi:hypothetical protein
MAFTDDLAGRTRAEQIALIQAAAREDGAELTDAEAAAALRFYAALGTSTSSAPARPAGAQRPCRAAGAQDATRNKGEQRQP